MSRKHIINGALLLGMSSLLSRILGVIRDRIFAVQFGALDAQGIHDLDIYFAAFRIPDFLYNFLVLGTLSLAFVPIFSRYVVGEKREDGFRFINTLFHFLLLTVGGAAILVFFLAPWLVPLIVPGFNGEKLDVTIQVTRIMLLSPIFFSFSSLAQSVQTSYRTFFYYSLAPIGYNLSIIVATFFLSQSLGVYGVAIGVVIGAFLHFLIQMPALWKLGYRYRFHFDWKIPELREMLRLVGPRIIGVSAMQFMLLVDTSLASVLPKGNLTIYSLAINLVSLPLGIVGISFAVSSFSTLSDLAEKKKIQTFLLQLSSLVEWILFLIIPATFGMYILRNEATAFILQGGMFSSKDTFFTARILGFLLLSLPFQSLSPLFSRAFFSWKDAKTPVRVVLTSVLVHIFLSVFFLRYLQWGMSGIAVAYSFAEAFQFFLLVLFFRKKFTVSLSSFVPFRSIFFFIFASLLMSGVIFVTQLLMSSFFQFLPFVISFFIPVFFAALFYFLFVRLVFGKKASFP
ncbi:murein biosynthesis integral membrane protein MurJ [Candidatus Peregrinibacteria bacterium]|nr:murein biosynthesis integral membrane protein MurJ [Candidatus Peregrinibacteria bacterium]